MGIMIDGIWHDADAGELQKSGHFVRSESYFRNWVTQDGSPGPGGKGGFTPTAADTIFMCRTPVHGRIAP